MENRVWLKRRLVEEEHLQMQNKYTLQRTLKARLTKADKSLTAMWGWKVGWGGLKFTGRDAIFSEEKEKANIIKQKKTNKHKPYSNRIDDTVGEVKAEERGPVKRLL